MTSTPSRRLLEEVPIAADAWTSEMDRVRDAAQGLVAKTVALSHPREGNAGLMFSDASDQFGGTFLT